jgi:hypothetical protein
MKAGPELDRIIMDHVLNWRYVSLAEAQEVGRIDHWANESGDLMWTLQRGYFQPSTRIEHAWAVVESMHGKKLQLSLGFSEHGIYYARFGPQIMNELADTASLAICRAALLATERKP